MEDIKLYEALYPKEEMSIVGGVRCKRKKGCEEVGTDYIDDASVICE